jgi:hypothetical protein
LLTKPQGAANHGDDSHGQQPFALKNCLRRGQFGGGHGQKLLKEKKQGKKNLEILAIKDCPNHGNDHVGCSA